MPATVVLGSRYPPVPRIPPPLVDAYAVRAGALVATGAARSGIDRVSSLALGVA